MIELLRRIKYKTKLSYIKTIFRLKELKRAVGIRRRKLLSKPKVIQLPITYLCNFDCVMCGMKNLINHKDFSADELGAILSDELFTDVEAIGVNGGEPFLKKDLVECINQMIVHLPKLREFYFISNGFFPDLISEKLTQIKTICSQKNIKIHLSLSVDGIYDMQDFHRGHVDAFKKVEETIKMLKETELIDSLNIICTLTKYNIERISEVEVWAKENNLNVSYNIATPNIRIDNYSKIDDFSLLNDVHKRMLAQEFFYHLFSETNEEKYYGLYLYLKTGKRYATCPCQICDWITLTPDSQLGFCATYSKSLGSCLENSAYKLKNSNIEYLKELCAEKCDTCSHYLTTLNAEGLHLMHSSFLQDHYFRGGNKW